MISPYFEENGAIIDANIILKAPCEKTGESEQRGKTDQQVMSPPRFQTNSRVSRNNSRTVLFRYSKQGKLYKHSNVKKILHNILLILSNASLKSRHVLIYTTVQNLIETFV